MPILGALINVSEGTLPSPAGSPVTQGCHCSSTICKGEG